MNNLKILGIDYTITDVYRVFRIKDYICGGIFFLKEGSSVRHCPCCGRKLEKFNKLEYEKTQEVYMKLDANSFKSALKRAKENVEKRGLEGLVNET